MAIGKHLTQPEDFELLKASRFTCVDCGLVSRPHKSVPTGYMGLDDDEVLCAMCYLAAFTEEALEGNHQHGRMLYCPDVSQADLNRLAQMSFLAKYRGEVLSDTASSLIAKIESDLTKPLKRLFPSFVDGDLASFNELMLSLPSDIQASADQVFSPLRYWPDYEAYLSVIEFWNVAAFKQLAF